VCRSPARTGTVNDHTDVWFIGYTPTYVTGVWMGYPGARKILATRMTWRARALAVLYRLHERLSEGQDRRKTFPKAPSMPEDMREMFKQRQRELAA
jgi:penicillin-binding protein 1A